MGFDGQQRVMRLSGLPRRSPAERQVLTNRMRENFTYGSVGGAEGNLGSYPAPNRCYALQFRECWVFRTLDSQPEPVSGSGR